MRAANDAQHWICFRRCRPIDRRAPRRNLPVRNGRSSAVLPNGISSPSRSARPSIPPKFARKSVERLPRTTGTSTPPEIASQARHPIFGWLIDNSSPAPTRATCPDGNVVGPRRTSKSPPHQATTRSSSKRRRKPPSVISRPASFSALPTRRLATCKACRSSAPPTETPNSRNPVRPKSWTLLRKPARKIVALISEARQTLPA